MSRRARTAGGHGSHPERSIVPLRPARPAGATGHSPDGEWPTVPGLLEVATTYLDRYDRPDLAAVVLDRVLEEEPDGIAALTLAARIAARKGEDGVAIALFNSVIERAPFDPEPRRHLAAALIGLGRLDEAIAQLREAARYAPQDAGVRFDLGAVLVHASHPEQAAEAFRAALARDPDCDRAIKALVVLDLEAGRFHVAADRYRTLLKHDGQNVRGHLIAAGPIGSVGDWCSRNGAPYRITVASGMEALHPPRYAGEPPPGVLTVRRPEAYLAEIADAVVIGGESVVLTAAGDTLLDIAVHERSDRFDLTERALRFAAEGAALVDAEGEAATSIPAAVHLLGVSSFNYFHWMVEALPRIANLEAADEAGEYARLPILVDAGAAAIGQHLETLRTLVGPDREIIAVEHQRAVHVGRLVMPSQLTWMSNNLKDGLLMEPEDVLISERAIRFLRERLTPPGIQRDRCGRRRISLVRASSKRLQNASELAPVLEKYAIEPVMPERLTPAEQVRLFAEADLVVSESGAGLTNLVFAPETARAIVLTGSSEWRPTWFSQISGVLGQSMTYLAGTVVTANPKTYQSCFTIDPLDLDRVLGDLLGGRSGGRKGDQP
jgi:capsular polysaccharide biosynthesis protein